VQVVNGIAAQYVETRGQLSASIRSQGEDFRNSALIYQAAQNGVSPPEEGFQIIERRKSGARPEDTVRLQPFELDSLPTSREPNLVRPTESTPPLASLAAKDLGSVSDSLQLHENLPSKLIATDSTAKDGKPTSYNDHEEAQRSTSITGIEENPNTAVISNLTRGKVAPENDKGRLGRITDGEELDRYRRNHAEGSAARRVAKTSTPPTREKPTSSLAGTDLAATFAPKATTPEPSESPHNSLPEDTVDGNASMIPPYGGISAIHRVREHRTPRPAYLKERKSAWLPDTIAVPADGIIRPD